jgi:small GTP-binding protein
MSGSSALLLSPVESGERSEPSPTSQSALQDVFSDNPASLSPGMVPTSHYQQSGNGRWQTNPNNSPRGSPPSREIPPESRLSNPYKQLDFGAQGYPDCMLKLVIIGDAGVGKSALLRRFAEGTYTDNMPSTVGVDFLNRRVNLDGRKVEFQLWDTAGQERFRAQMASYYRGAQGILLVYDVTDEKSFKNLDRWLADVEKHAGKSCKRILVGNKCDKVSERKVDFSTAQEWCETDGGKIKVFETSAKEGVMVDDTFTTLARQIISEAGANGARRSGAVGLQSIAGPNTYPPRQQPASSCC